jgi:hypothetical protein
MVTPSQQMREFALECVRWSEVADSASQRDMMIELAKTWMHAASQIDRRAAAVDGIEAFGPRADPDRPR